MRVHQNLCKKEYGRNRGRWLFLLLGTVIYLMTGTASADSWCIPNANGVPALSGAPQWWDSSVGEPNYWPRLDDPRWRGALAKSFGVGANEHVSFRALRRADAVYLSWYVKVDPLLEPWVDALRVGFSPGGGAPDQLIEVFPFTDAASDLVAAVPPSTATQLRTGAGGTWVAQAAEPAWLATAAGYARVWLDVSEQVWAINMRVPIAAAYNDGIALSSNFRMWFELQTGVPGSGVVYYRFDSLSYGDIINGTNANAWSEFSRTLATSDPSCYKGVSIASSGVGTRFVDGGGVARPNRIDVDGPNTFFAEPTNNTGASIMGGQIQGTFRIANWGTQVNWNDVTDPTTLWKQINPGPVTNGGLIANGSTASQAAGNDLNFAWSLTHDERCEFVGKSGAGSIPGDPTCANNQPTRRLHQCMLVELSGGGYTYTPVSVYRNMDFVDASTFAREAEVSVAGLPERPGATNRDVFLYEKTYQMPKAVNTKPPRNLLLDIKKMWDILNQPMYGIVGREKSRTAAYPGPYIDMIPLDDLPTYPPVGQVSFDILNQIYPTYVMHAYHDTGETVNIRGNVRRVLRPQSSFGYYVHHDGELEGWDTAVNGAVRIAPHYYRISPPEGGSQVISTEINAREPGEKPCGCFNPVCWIKGNR